MPRNDDRMRDLERALRAAGDRARITDLDPGRPDPAFARALRERLTDQLPARDAEASGSGPWFLRWLAPLPRLAPLALGAILLVAGAVAGRELYIALGNQPSPTPAPSIEATLEPTAVPATPDSEATVEPAPSVLPEPTAEPTEAPTAEPEPTVKPEPTAEPTPEIGFLSLEATGCHGGVILDWSPYDGEWPFNHYTTLRNTEPVIPKAYPPQGGAVDPGGTYTTWVEKTSAVDTSGEPGTTYYYRAMAFNADDQVIAASDIVSATPKPVKLLGGLEVTPDAGGTRLSWTPYGGPEWCFDFYKIVYSLTDETPSYLDGDPYLAALSDQGASTFVSPDLVSGKTYFIRVQALRGTELGGFVVAQTEVATYTVP